MAIFITGARKGLGRYFTEAFLKEGCSVLEVAAYESFCPEKMPEITKQALSNQEVELLNLELDTQMINLNISQEYLFLKPAPYYICKGLNLRQGSYWITCLAEVIDRHKPPLNGKTKGVEIYDELLKKGLVVG